MTRLAAVDCGTNSIRLLICDVSGSPEGRRTTELHRTMRIVRLGQGVDAHGEFLPEALQRTRDALEEYAGLMKREHVAAVWMVATSATRDAANREVFFRMTEEILGTRAEVISGDTEAALSFRGAVQDIAADRGSF